MRTPKPVLDGTVEYERGIEHFKLAGKTVEELNALFAEYVPEEEHRKTARLIMQALEGKMKYWLVYRKNATEEQIQAWNDYQNLQALKQKLEGQGYLGVL